MAKELTVEQLKKALPSRKGTITDELVDIINKVNLEPEFQGENLLATMIHYESVMVKAKSSVHEYISAIRFCAYLLTMDDNYTEAYKRTFWDRPFIQDRLGCATNSKEYGEITSAASRYRRSKLVVDILTLSQTPLDLIFAGHRMKAIGVLADRMEHGKLDKDRIAAADALLKHTTPKDFKIELDVGVKQDSATQNLMDQLAGIATRQKELLASGVTNLGTLGAMKVASDVMEGEYEEV